jgi:hypothetical protein
MQEFSALEKLKYPTFYTLKSKGEALVEEIRQELNFDLQGYEDQHLFAVFMAKALTWADYASSSDESFNRIIEFIGSKEPFQHVDFQSCYGRYGLKKLEEALYSYRELLRFIKKTFSKDLRNASSTETCRLYHSVLNFYVVQKREWKLEGIGDWFFSILFYQLIIYLGMSHLNRAFNEILMPIGKEVERAIRTAKKESWPYFDHVNLPVKKRGGNKSGALTEAYLKHSNLVYLANQLNTTPLLVSAGLYNIGR